MRKFFSISLALAVLAFALTACGGSSAGEPAFTAAQGPADAALPYQAVFAVSENADERLVDAAKSFCRRTAELSRGGAVFSLVSSKDALQDLKTGKADVILLENAEVSAFATVADAFRYKSYEHFSMAANSASTLKILSDVLDANVLAGFYTGSNVLLSHGTLDSKFRPSPRKDAEIAQEPQTVPVTVLPSSARRVFSLLKASVSVETDLDARIRAFSVSGSVVEFSYAELGSPALLTALRGYVPKNAESVTAEPEPPTITQALTEIKPVWLVFSAQDYEKLSQTNRAAVAEAAAYMTADIDDVYLKYEREMTEPLAAEGAVISREFAATRALALRLADEADTKSGGLERELRESIAKIQ